jgi:ornithine cyclodeaminase/alanine dehydrogenase-like protein (mu-crystallin family)
VKVGRISREEVTELGAVLAGRAAGRAGDDEITLFDSTGLAIQDLAIARAVLDAWRDGAVAATQIDL